MVGYQEITGHIVFDIKLGENFSQKSRYCADGHKIKSPAALTYSMVVSRDSVTIILSTDAMNGFEVMGANVYNAFMTAP